MMSSMETTLPPLDVGDGWTLTVSRKVDTESNPGAPQIERITAIHDSGWLTDPDGQEHAVPSEAISEVWAEMRRLNTDTADEAMRLLRVLADEMKRHLLERGSLT